MTPSTQILDGKDSHICHITDAHDCFWPEWEEAFGRSFWSLSDVEIEQTLSEYLVGEMGYLSWTIKDTCK